MLLLMEEDGWWSKGDKMAVLTSTEVGQSMKKDLVASLVSYGMAYIHPLHCLTNQGQWRLRIDFTFTNGTKSYIAYNSFLVGPANSQYQLNISGFTGIISEDPFYNYPINGMKFTTKDRDNDNSSGNCALGGNGKDAGGWWHNNCANIHPNHQYKSMYGMQIRGKWYSFQFIEMKIKPSKC